MSEKTKNTKRTAPISYRPPKEREAEFRERVAASGRTVNAFVTDCIFSGGRNRPAELKTLARLLGKAAQISDQFHEIAPTESGDNPLPIEAAHRELTEIRAALLILMGRKA